MRAAPKASFILLFVIVMFSTSIRSLRVAPSIGRLSNMMAFATKPLKPSNMKVGKVGGNRHFKRKPAPTAEEIAKDRPFTLPPGLHKPKQSLGQNYLSDQNYVVKICDAFKDDSEQGDRVVEIGPGMGALTRVLVRKYPKMTAVEIDQRSVRFLNEKLPELNVIHGDVLEFDWSQLAADKGGKLSVVANLPYHITSQVLFSLADSYRAINKAVVTMQWEVAERVTAKPSTKDYGIPSVVFQLYGRTELNFKIPPKVFFPVPKVDSALVTIDFNYPHKNLHLVEGDHLRRIITAAFRQRRKMMRQSLKSMLEKEGITIPERWGTMRPEQLKPAQFIELTMDLFGPKGSATSDAALERAARAAALHREITSTTKGGKVDVRSLLQSATAPKSEISSSVSGISASAGTKTSLSSEDSESSEESVEESSGTSTEEASSSTNRASLLRSLLSRRDLRREKSGATNLPQSFKIPSSIDSDASSTSTSTDTTTTTTDSSNGDDAYVKKSNKTKKAEKLGLTLSSTTTSTSTSTSTNVSSDKPRADKSQYESESVWRKAFGNYHI